ncbi:unnamed protein product [Gulo gulo]|uniref:Uncharacterized protein n=1 Tax=Gulo gulo TaxID=48420 RepID=A0A9X9PY04_GULGU|nr:unnamed protein product [Gulo gulo]
MGSRPWRRVGVLC